MFIKLCELLLFTLQLMQDDTLVQDHGFLKKKTNRGRCPEKSAQMRSGRCGHESATQKPPNSGQVTSPSLSFLISKMGTVPTF